MSALKDEGLKRIVSGDHRGESPIDKKPSVKPDEGDILIYFIKNTLSCDAST